MSSHLTPYYLCSLTATKDATNLVWKISSKSQMWHFSELCSICSWAAYVVGCIIVLMHEEQAEFKEGLSLLINSEVPDGKGVSSSAALEVASMSAIASAYGIKLQPSHLASLCQKVGHPTTHNPLLPLEHVSKSGNLHVDEGMRLARDGHLSPGTRGSSPVSDPEFIVRIVFPLHLTGPRPYKGSFALLLELYYQVNSAMPSNFT